MCCMLRLAACMAIVLLGICSQLGMPPIAVTVLYAAIMLASAVVIGRDVRAVWAEGVVCLKLGSLGGTRPWKNE